MRIRPYHIATTLLFLLASSLSAQTKADSTICVSFRTITNTNGSIRSTSVTKVSCGTTIIKADTLIRTRVDSVNTFWSLTCLLSTMRCIYGISQALPTKPVNFNLPRDTVIKRDTVTRVDTVRVPIVTPPTSAVDTIPGLHIFDLPSRVGEFNTYLNTEWLGRLMWQSIPIGKIWWSVPSDSNTRTIVRGPYADSVTAMRALTGITTGTRVALPTGTPALPGAIVDPRMPPTPGTIIPVP